MARVLVSHDLLGLFEPIAKFVQQYAQISKSRRRSRLTRRCGVGKLPGGGALLGIKDEVLTGCINCSRSRSTNYIKG